jgi:flagellar hook protein FlgE
MSSFSIPLSGLDASQQALSVIANNLANMNTVGYKNEDINFQDLFYQSLGTSGSGDALEVGAGVGVGSISGNFTSSTVESTGVPTDVAINGNGFLVTQGSGETEYTRAGDLQVSNTGFLQTQDGQNVMGYPAINGVISNANLAPLQVGTGSTVPATATTSLNMNLNLNASSAVGSTFSNPMTVYDSLGTAQVVNFEFTNTGANAWSYTATVPDTALSVNPTTGLPVVPANPAAELQIGSGTMGFDANGNLSTVNGNAINPAGGSSVPNISGITLSNLTDGASTMNLSWQVLNSSGNSLITQTSAASAPSASAQNGFASGTLSSFAIDTDGTIEGAYTNGQSLALGQVALAQFGNDDGLARMGNNSFQSTVASGQAVVGAPGSGGLGTLTGGSLEQSNVDMATQFSAMILNQSGYEANAKVITTFNQIEQATINIEQG